MAHTYYQNYYHLVWSTKERKALIPHESKSRVFEYAYGALKNADCVPQIIGGMTDHIHILAEIPPKYAISDIVRDIKICTSKWITSTFSTDVKFAWQEGFGSFTVSASKRDLVVKYIQNQEKHHKVKTFREEFIELLIKHGIAYDKKYLWK